jgi:hypothetical protein
LRGERLRTKPLTVTLKPEIGSLVRGFAWAQRCTYESAVEQCVLAMLMSGGPVMLEPFGEPESVMVEAKEIE